MNTPIIISYNFNSGIEKVWNALSKEDELKQWYFPVDNYEFEVGKTFTFYESCDSKQYFHSCQFLNIIPNKLIEYSWAHPNQSKGTSVVKWEIEPNGEQIKVTLTHTGIETFADAGAAFSKDNFEMGWNAIIGNMLRNYLYGIKKLQFSVELNADASKVWQNLWDKETYKQWTKPFMEGSYYEGEMLLNKRIHFLIPSGDGMYSDVAFYKENELMIFKHIGLVKNNQEMPIDATTEKWTGSFESYKLAATDNKTTLKVEVDANEMMYDYLSKTFPVALVTLKEIIEG